MKELKLSCQREDETIRIEEACNGLILTSRWQCQDGKVGSYGSIEECGIYNILIREGLLSDLRPWLPLRNYIGGKKVDTTEWWDNVRKEYNDVDFWRDQYLKVVSERDALRAGIRRMRRDLKELERGIK